MVVDERLKPVNNLRMLSLVGAQSKRIKNAQSADNLLVDTERSPVQIRVGPYPLEFKTFKICILLNIDHSIVWS